MASSFEFRSAVVAVPKMCAAEEIFRTGWFKASSSSICAHGKAPSRNGSDLSRSKRADHRSSWDEYARLSFMDEDAAFEDPLVTSSKSARKWSVKSLFLPRCMAVKAKPKLARVSSQSQEVCSAVLPSNAGGPFAVRNYNFASQIPNRGQNERPPAAAAAAIGCPDAATKARTLSIARSFSSKSAERPSQQKMRCASVRDPPQLSRRKTFLPYRQTVLPLLA